MNRNVIPIKQINCKWSNRSREIITIHVSKPNTNRKTFVDRDTTAIVINVITNDA